MNKENRGEQTHTQGRKRAKSALEIASSCAAIVFRKRGNHSEAHIAQEELTSIILAAITVDREERTVVDELKAQETCKTQSNAQKSAAQVLKCVACEGKGWERSGGYGQACPACERCAGSGVEPTPEIEAIRISLAWLKCALECKDWRWDMDQKEAAQGSYDEAKAALETLRTQARKKRTGEIL